MRKEFMIEPYLISLDSIIKRRDNIMSIFKEVVSIFTAFNQKHFDNTDYLSEVEF